MVVMVDVEDTVEAMVAVEDTVAATVDTVEREMLMPNLKQMQLPKPMLMPLPTMVMVDMEDMVDMVDTDTDVNEEVP